MNTRSRRWVKEMRLELAILLDVERNEERVIDFLAAALAQARREGKREGVEAMIAALVGSPYAERMAYNNAKGWYDGLAARVLAEGKKT